MRDRHPYAIYHDTYVSIEEYLRIQDENLMKEYPEGIEVEYYATPRSHEKTIVQYEQDNNKINIPLTEEDYDLIHKPFYDLIDTLLELNTYIEESKYTPYFYGIPYMKVFLYACYLVCWTYILFKSFHTVTTWPITLKILEILNTYIPLIEPFSQTLL